MTEFGLTVRAVTARCVDVPMARPLQTSGGAVTSAPFVLVDLQTEQGPAGSAYVFAYTARVLGPLASLVVQLSEVLRGLPAAPLALAEKMHGFFRLLGPQGLGGMALSGIDMAAWDAQARAAGVPLARLLGGEPAPIPAYNSCGLGIIGAAKAGKEAADLCRLGLGAIKVRLGYADAGEDARVVHTVRAAIGEEMPLMADYNQSLSVAEAETRIHRLRDQGMYWIEEPTRFDDYAGHARLRQKARIPIQIGENCWGPHDMSKALAAGACDYFMPDAGKIWGVTGWLRAAALAEPVGMPISSHLYPEISAHLLSVTPTRHWLEYVDWANPILAEPAAVKGGCVAPPSGPGSGMRWEEKAVARFLV